MTEQERDMVEQSEDAWADFEQKLVQYVGEVPTGTVLTLNLAGPDEPDHGALPWVQVMKGEDGVMVAVVSNQHLAEVYALDEEREALLREWGFQPPGGEVTLEPFAENATPAWTLIEWEPQADPEVVASAAVETLRQVFGVIDPAFLGIEGCADAGAWTRLVPTGPGCAAPVLRPSSPDDLRALLGATLEWLVEEPVEVDDDGDWWFPHRSTRVYVTARGDGPMVDVFTRVVAGVRSRRQASLELAILNRQHAAKFVLHDREVYQVMTLAASPYVDEHLQFMMPLFLTTLDEVAADLSLRTGGRA